MTCMYVHSCASVNILTSITLDNNNYYTFRSLTIILTDYLESYIVIWV